MSLTPSNETASYPQTPAAPIGPHDFVGDMGRFASGQIDAVGGVAPDHPKAAQIHGILQGMFGIPSSMALPALGMGATATALGAALVGGADPLIAEAGAMVGAYISVTGGSRGRG